MAGKGGGKVAVCSSGNIPEIALSWGIIGGDRGERLKLLLCAKFSTLKNQSVRKVPMINRHKTTLFPMILSHFTTLFHR